MVQEIKTNSWGNRILSALWGVIIGFVLIIGSFVLVFWNEGHGLHLAQALHQAQQLLVTIPNTPMDPSHEKQVVYLSGLATTTDVLHDKLLSVSENAIQLNRHVEMYQWEQEEETKTEKQMGGSEQEVTTYSYKQVWSDKLLDSSEYKESAGHKNPTEMPIRSNIQYANKVTVGDFSLPAGLIKEIGGETPVNLSKTNLHKVSERVHKPVHLQADMIYLGDDASSPKIGDMRVTITAVLPQTVSIIAQQDGKTLQPFKADSGELISLIVIGEVSPTQMIHDAEMQNQIMTWGLRLVSLVMMMIGFGLLMKPVSVLADVVPFFGNLVEFGCGLIAFIAGLGCWSLAIAIAWIAVRPAWAVGLILLTAGICYYVYRIKKVK